MKIVNTLKRIEALESGSYKAYARHDARSQELSDILDDKAYKLKKELRLYIKETEKYDQLILAKRYLNIK